MPRIHNFDATPYMNDYIHAVWAKRGKDLSKCEFCEVELDRSTGQIHHTKYEGATIDDLRWICVSCNLQPENIGLT